MKYLKSYTLYERFSKETKLFESGKLVTFAMAKRMRKIKSTITDILRDNVLDKDIPLKIHVRNYTDIRLNNPVEVIKIQIGDELLDIDNFIRVEELKDDIITITNYLEDEGFEYSTFSYIDDEGDIHGDEGDVMKTVGLETTYLSLFYKREIKDPHLEKIEVPIEVGDTVLGGRFKNRRMVVKKIGKNKKGDITINDKPLLKFRLVKENSQEDIDYYFRHLEDDNFLIQVMRDGSGVKVDYFRIFKPKNGSTYSYSNCNPFQWSEISGEIGRYVDELDDSGKSEKLAETLSGVYVIKSEGGVINRKEIHPKLLLNENFDAGEILSFTIGFK